jgi:carboxymethylenebutenolidase
LRIWSGWLHRKSASPAKARRFPDTWPARATTTPISGLILLHHDIFGVSDHARDVARRFANVGFATLVPDCFARIELGTDESRVRERAARLDDRLTVRDIENAAALLRGLPFCNGKVGTVGFCMGGRSALLLACSSDKIDATIDCWGGSITPDTGVGALHPVPVVDLVKNIRRPVYAVFGKMVSFFKTHLS